MRFEENHTFSPSQLDFVPRGRRNQGQKLIAAFLISIFLFLFLSYVPVFSDTVILPLLMSVILAGLGVFTMVILQRNLDLLMTAEHQNMLFTQAMVMGSQFCLLAKRNGTVVYMDSGLHALFDIPAQSQALTTILEKTHVSATDRERIMGAIYNNVSDQIILPLQTKTGQTSNYVLNLEPMSRPQGYSVLRGREYRGTRAESAVMPDTLRTTSIDKLDHLLAHTPIGHYATDAFGRFEYVNATLERKLGYASNEIILSRLTLIKVFKQIAGNNLPEEYTINDFQHRVTLQTKTGEFAEGIVIQTTIRNEQGKITGATGSILFPEFLESINA